MRRDGDPIVLVDHRFLRNEVEADWLVAVLREIAASANVPLTDRGVVRSAGGVLNTWRVHPVDWPEPPLSEADVDQPWQAVKYSISTIQFTNAILVLFRIGCFSRREVYYLRVGTALRTSAQNPAAPSSASQSTE